MKRFLKTVFAVFVLFWYFIQIKLINPNKDYREKPEDKPDELYGIDLVATALQFSEVICEQLDSEPDVSDEDIEGFMLSALSKVGYSDIDKKVLNQSMHYYLTNTEVEGILDSAVIKDFPEEIL